jgi:C-terminal processing protease CtpA/Prc
MTEVDPTDHPAILANVGDATFRRWILVLDYRNQIVDFRPGGDTSGTVALDHSGISLSAKGNALLVAFVLHGTPAAMAGVVAGDRISVVNGRTVSASDVTFVRNLLRGAPGTRVIMRIGNGSKRIVTLRRYL